MLRAPYLALLGSPRVRRFAIEDDEGFHRFLAEHRDAVVLLRGLGCAYSRAFEKVFEEWAPRVAVPVAVRDVEEAGRGAVGEALGVDVTPTVARFVEGAESARLDGIILLGITRQRYRKWLAEQKLAKKE